MTPLPNILPHAGANMLERILAAPGALVALHAGDDRDALLAQFATLARRSGQSIYLWQPATGLANLREVDAAMPGSQRFGNALRYIQQSLHFGVYLLTALPTPLAAVDAALLRQLAGEAVGHVRRIVLLDAPEPLIESLGNDIVRLGVPSQATQRPRLRDGHWVA